MSFQNPTEEFVFRVCRKTFLSLWSYANPCGDPGEELCDVLVVCDPDVVVVSVKDVRLNRAAALDVATQRWLKKAVDDSAKQLYGAVRWLERHDRVTRSDGTEGLLLPPPNTRRVHRISVSLGSEGEVSLPSRDYGKGFVHVLDERSFVLLMENLDTITDFVDYLTAKEELAARLPGLIVEGEENLLAIYLHRGRTFPPDLLDGRVIPNGLWDQLVANPAFQRKVDADQVSYLWDRLLDYFGGHALHGTFEFGNELTQNEVTFREMARENRLGRRVLAESLGEFLNEAQAGRLRARFCKSPRGVGYVFVNARPDSSREERKAELEMRCFVARGHLECETVIGICHNAKAAPQGYCEEVLMLRILEWTPKHAEQAELIKTRLGFFAQPRETKGRVDEFPPEEGSSGSAVPC